MSDIRIKYIIICLCCLFLLPGKIFSHTDFFLSHLGVEDGLSQLSVLIIYQDSEGYLWFGTRDGVNKYNGYEFTIYRNEVNNPESLSDGYIQGIAEDKYKNIWVATQNGLNCIERQTGKVIRFYPKDINPQSKTNAVNQLFYHTDSTLYAISEKHIFICKNSQEVECFLHLENLASNIGCITQDPENSNIYLGTQGDGVSILSKDWNFIEKLSTNEATKNNDLLTSHISSILCDKDEIWMVTDDKGLYNYDKKSSKLSIYNDSNTNLSHNHIRTLIQYNEESLLIGTFRGLNIFNKKDKTITPVQMEMEQQGGLSHYSIHSMLMDKDGTLWVGTYAAGINYYSPYHKAISYIKSNDFSGVMGMGQEDKEGNLWFATEGGGLFWYNPKTKEQKLYPLKPLIQGNYEMNIIKAVLLKGDSIFCSTHFGSVYLFSIPEKKYTLLYDYKSHDIYNLYIDKKDRLWIPTNNSNWLVLASKGKTQNRFEVQAQERYFRYITLIEELEPDLFLMGSMTDSIYLYNMEQKKVENIANRMYGSDKQLKLGYTSGILKDSSYIWIATTKGGLFRFDDSLNLLKHYDRRDGIAGSNIRTIVLDKNKDLWVATGDELYKLNRLEDMFYPIKPEDLPTQEFSHYSGTISEDGTLYFPTSDGILYFNPQQIKQNPIIPPIHITSLVTNNNEDVLKQMEYKDSKESKIVLKSNQNNLTIRYAALNYIHTDGNQYMYRLDGADNNWHIVGNRREAYYSNLHPGSYLFRLKASNNDGLWNPDETILHITVLPPLYRTWWAYTLYIFILIIISFQIYRYQHRKHELERDIRFKQKEQEKIKELHEERMRMFNNFSHELRTPLTLIINPLDELLQSISFSAEVKQSLQRMKKNTKRMLLLVNNLMDVQKYEAGKTKLQQKKLDFSVFIREIYLSYESIAKRRNIQFILQNELPASYYVYYDETEIEKVFFNILSNAFKFTPSQGTVTLLVKKAGKETDKIEYGDQHYLYIEVKDTGKGFSNEESSKIFEPFYRFNEDIHHQMSGTGIGLSLTRSIVLQHNGYIWAESSKESDTRFMLLLPDTETQSEKEMSVIDTPASEINKKAMLLLEEVEIRNKETILIVDDDSEIREYMRQQLHPEYKIIMAANGKEALALIESNMPQMVISDVIMPEMSGMELCKQIKSNAKFAHIPVILLTAKSMASQIEEGFNTGADDYITKPFQISIVKARIRNLLNSNRKKVKQSDPTALLKTMGIVVSEEKDNFLSQYIAIVKENIANSELDVSLIYEKLGMSRANFYRKVKTTTGLSPIELIRNIRLEAGAQLLRETNLNISEIAQKTGFSSRSYFARNFKLVYGITPKDYQDDNQRKEKES